MKCVAFTRCISVDEEFSIRSLLVFSSFDAIIKMTLQLLKVFCSIYKCLEMFAVVYGSQLTFCCV